ncbi:MAG: Flp pilus assembly protein CpaB [Rubripirellula sp.]
MRNKSIYLLLACVCGTVAAILASQWIKAQANTGGQGPIAEIFVASVAIDIGEKITAEKIQLEQWPADKVPQGSSGELETLEGKYAKQRFYEGEAIMPVKLMEENWTTVPKGYRVVAMKASDVSIANLVQPGDRVDVMAYFNKSEIIPRSMTKTVLMGVRVYALDGDTGRKIGEDRPKTLRNIQLLIHEKDAEAWTYANELGKIRLSLGSDDDYSTEDGSNQAAQEFLTWLEDHREAKEAERLRLEALANAPKPSNNSTAAPTSKKKEGFRMLMLGSDGRMKEYLIVDGELPKVLGEAGSGNDSVSTESDSTGLPRETPIEDEFSYLNGDESPFYQPPSDDSTEAKTNY